MQDGLVITWGSYGENKNYAEAEKTLEISALQVSHPQGKLLGPNFESSKSTHKQNPPVLAETSSADVPGRSSLTYVCPVYFSANLYQILKTM